MNLPQVYMCSPSWTLLPPPSPYNPSGSSQCTSPKHPVSCIEPGLVVTLPMAHLTSHSRRSGSRWVITPSWLSWSWRSILYSSSGSCYLFLISSASVMSITFLSFIEPIFAWNVPLVSLISLKRSLVLPILLFSFISLHWSLRKAFLFLLAILCNSAFKWVYLSFSPLLFASLLFTAICKASPDSYFFFFLYLFSMGMVLLLVSCTVSQTLCP